MELTPFDEIPVIVGELITVSPVTVKPGDSYEALKVKLDSREGIAGSLNLAIQTDLLYSQGIELAQSYKMLLSSIEASIDASKAEIDNATETIANLRIKLVKPITITISALRAETARYAQELEVRKKEAEAEQLRKSEAVRDRNQRQNDMLRLREELAGARQVADRADLAGEKETAKEIRKALYRFHTLDTEPGSFMKPLKDAAEIRSVVAKALQHEQERNHTAKEQ